MIDTVRASRNQLAIAKKRLENADVRHIQLLSCNRLLFNVGFILLISLKRQEKQNLIFLYIDKNKSTVSCYK